MKSTITALLYSAAAVAAFVLVEKMVPSGEFIGRTAGIALILVGFGVLAL